MELEKCSVCGEPIFREIDIMGTKKYLRRMCACRRKEVEEEAAIDRANVLYSEARRILDVGYLDKAYAGYTFASADEKDSTIVSQMKQYADNFDKAVKVNKGIYLFGNAGVGKTFYASCIANEVRKKGVYVLIGSASDFIRYFTKDYGRNEEAEKQIRTYPLMIIDDIGVESMTDYYGEKRDMVSEIIDRCEKRGRLFIATTNLTPNEISERYGLRTLDRLKSITKAIKFYGDSLRQ